MQDDRLEAFLMSRRDHPAAEILRRLAMPLYPLVHVGVQSYLRSRERNGKRLPRPVISVGNITVGGTGKTTFIRLLLELLEGRGSRPAVLFRGYKREGSGIVAVSIGGGPLVDYRLSGDEPYMIANSPSRAAVFVDEDRYESGLVAFEKYSPDVFLLDDGFQHVGLRRDLDIVLVDSTDPFDNGRLFPFGMLREPLSGLRRAHLVIITRCNQSDTVEAAEAVVRGIAPTLPIVRASHEPGSLLTCDGRPLDLTLLRDRAVYTFSGIGNHASFYLTAMECGADIRAADSFPDHHRYSSDELSRLGERADASGAEWLLTTEKDMVRVPDVDLTIPLYAVSVKMAILSGIEHLESALDRALARAPSS